MRRARWRRAPWPFLSCVCSCLLWPVFLGSTIANTSAIYNGTAGITTETSTVLPNTQKTAFTHSSQTVLGTTMGPNTNSTDSAVLNTPLTHSAVTSSANGGTTTSHNSPSFTTSSSGSSDITKTTNKIWSTTTTPTSTQGTRTQTSVAVTFNISPTISGNSTSDDKMGLSTTVPASTSTPQASIGLQTHEAQSSQSTGKPQNKNSPSSFSDINTRVIPPAPPSIPTGHKSTESISQETSASGGISAVVTAEENSTDQPVYTTSTLISASSDMSTSGKTFLESTLLPSCNSTQGTTPCTGSTTHSLPTSLISTVTDTIKIVTQSSSSAPIRHSPPGNDSQGLSPPDETTTTTSPSRDSYPTQRTTEPLKTAETFVTTQRSTREQADSITRTLVSIPSELSTADSTSGQTTPFHTSSLVQVMAADSQMTISPVTLPTQESQTSYLVPPATENIKILTSLSPSYIPTTYLSSDVSQETTITKSAFSQTHQTQRRETTIESQTSTITRVRIPHPPFSPSGQISTGIISQEKSTPGETTLPTSWLYTAPIMKDHTLGNTGETTISGTTRFSSVTSKISIMRGSGVQSTPILTGPSIQTTSTNIQMHQSKGMEMKSVPDDNTSASSLVLQTAITPGGETTFFSSSSGEEHTTQSQSKLFSTLTSTDKSLIPSQSTPTSKTSTYTWVTTETLKRQEDGGPTTPMKLTTTPHNSHTNGTQVTETTENFHVSKSDTSVTQTVKTSKSNITLDTTSGQKSTQTISGDFTWNTTSVAFNTSIAESPAGSQMTHTHHKQTTQEYQTSRSSVPSTNTIRTVTAPTPSSYPSGHSSSESLPLETATTDTLTISTFVPSGMNHTTQAPTVEQWASQTSLDTTLGISGDNSLSPISTTAQVPSVSSVPRGPGGQATLSSSSTSPDRTSSISLTQESRGREITEVHHTSTSASLLTDKTWVGTTATSSSTINSHTSLGSPLPEGFTSGKTVAFKPALSSDSHTTPSTTELFSDTNILDTAQGTKGNMSPTFRGDISPTVSEASTTVRPTGESISTSFSTPSRETPSISQITQTKGMGTISGSETISSVSRVTDTFPTAISSAPSSAPNVGTSPQAMGHTLSPSSPIISFSSTPVSDGNTPQIGMPSLPTGLAEVPPAVTSGPLSDVTSHSSTMQSTSREVLPTGTSFTDIHDNVTTAHPVGSEVGLLTETAQVPSSSVGVSDEPTAGRPVAVQSVASATNPITSPTYVTSTSNPIGTAGTTLTQSDEPTFRSSPRTSPMTTSDTSTSQPTTTYTFTPTPTLAVSPSGDAHTATELWSSPISPVTTQGEPRDISLTVSGSSTSSASTATDSTRKSAPLSTNTSPVEMGTVSQMTHTQGAQTTQQPRNSRSAFPNTDTIRIVTATAPSSYPSGHSSSESLPLDTATTDTLTISTSVPSGMSHTTQAPTVEQWASPMSLDTTLGMLGDTSLSPTSTVAQVPSVSSVSGGPGGQATSSSSGTSPDVTSAISLTQESRGRETTEVPHSSKSASLLTDKTWVGTTATSSSTINSQTSSGSPLPEGFTSGKTVAFKPALSSDSHTTPSTTELFSDTNILDTAQGTKGNVSPTFRGDISPTVSEASTTVRPTGESISTSSSNSPQETPPISQKAQTRGVGTNSRSETISSVSRVADSFPTAIPSPPSSTPNGHRSPGSMGPTQSPSSPIATFSSSPDRESHTPQTATSVFPTGSTEGMPVLSSGTVSDVTSHSPSTMWSTSGEVLPTSTSLSDTPDNVTAAHPVGSESVSLTETTQVPSSSVGISRKTTTRHPVTVQSVAPATDPIPSPTYVSSTSHPISTAGSTHTSSDETTSHSSPRTTVMTASGTSTSQPTTSHAFTLTPTSAVSSSSDTDTATELGSSPLSPVTTQGSAGDVSPTVSGHSASDASATAEPTRPSTPLSASTSPAEPAAVTQMSNTQGAHATQESQTSRSGFPSTNTIRTVTATTPSSYPSGQSASESVPLNTPPQGTGTVSGPALSGKSHTTWASTTEEWATPMSPDTTLGTSGDTSLSPTSTIAQVTSVVSISVGSGREATSPSPRTSPDGKSAFSQTHQPRGTETTGAPHTSKSASSLTDTTWEGTTAPSSFTVVRQASSGSPPPEKFTSGATAPLTTTLSSDSHTTPTTTELLSNSATLATTPETILPKGTTATISEASTTGRPTGQSISISFSTPSWETPSISQITQTKGMGTISGSETISSVSRVTDTFPTAISSAPSSAPNVGTSPQAMGHTLSPSSPIISFSSTPVSDGHTRQTGRTHLATGSTERLHAVTSGPLSDVTSHFSTMQSTNGEVLPTGTSFSDIHDNVTTSHPVGSEGVLLTETAQVPSSPVAVSDEPTAGRPVAVQSVASATNPITSPTYVTSTSNSIGTAGTTLTQSDEPTFRSSPRTSPMTTSDTSTSQPTTTYTFTPTPTLAVSPSGDAHTATELWSSPISPVTTQGEPRDISPTVSGSSTSSASTATDSTRQSAPLSTNTSPVETGTVSQMTHTQGAQTTQQPRTSRSAFPNTDTIRIVTATAPSSYPSGHSSSESLPLDTATTDSLTISTSVPSGMSHTTQAPTVEQWASPMSLDTTLGMLGDTSLSPTSTIAQVPSVSSVSGGPGGQATSSSSGTSPDVTSAISLTQESRGRETTEVPHSSNSASLLTDKIWVGTTATSSSTINSQTSSGSPLPEGFTSGKTVAFKPALSSDSHTTPSTTELFSDTNILDTAQGTKGNVSPTFRGDISPTVSEASTTGRPTGESISTSSSNSPQETPPISQKAQTRGVGTNSRSETISSVSRVADSFPTAIPSPPSSTPNGHRSPGSMGPTQSPSSPIATFSSSPDRESHTPQTATSVFPTGSTEGTPVLSSGTVSDVTSHSPSTMWSTSGEVLPTSTSLSDTPDNVTAAHPVGSESVSLTETTQVPSSSVGISRKTTTRHPVTVQSVAPATDPIPSPTYVSSTSHPISTAGSTHTSSDETTSHSSPRTTVMTASGTSTSQPTTSHAFTLTPTSAVSSSSDTDTATELGSSPLSPVTTQGSAGDVSPTVSGHSASDASATAEPTRQSTPLSASTSPAEPAAVTQMSNTQGAHATQESQTSRSGFPSTNTIRTVTATTPSSYPSGQSASESVPLNTPPQGTGTVSGPALSGKSHTTWASTTEEWATPMSPDTTLGTSGDTSLSPTSTIAQVTSVVSVSVGSGREATSPSPRTSPDGKSAFSQTHQPRGTETTGAPHTSKSASSLTDTTWEGTTAPSSFTVVRQASSGSPPPEKFTSGATAPLTTTLSSDSHTTPTTTELLSNSATLATTPETILPKGTTATISEASTTGRPTGQSISISFSTPSRETPSISQITQTKGMGTISGSETISSVSRVTDTFPTAISSAPSSAPNVGTSPQAMGHTLSPSSPIISFSSTPVSDGHTRQTGRTHLATGSTERLHAVTSGPLSDVTSHFSTMQSTNGEVLPTGTSFSDIHDNVTTSHPVGSEGVLLTETAQVPSSPVAVSDEPTAGRPVAVQSVASATNPITSPTYVTSTSNSIGTAGTTLTQSDEPTFRSSPRTSPMTTSDTSTSQPITTYTFTPTPTLAVSPSGDAHTATELWSSPISPVTTQGEPRDISPTVSGSSTSSASTATDSTRQSAPLSTNTSPVETGTVSQMTHTQGAQTTQQPRTSRSAFPNTDTIRIVTATAPSSYPSGHSSSESLPLDTATTDSLTISTSVPSGMSHTTQAPTVEQWASPMSLDTTLGMLGDTSLSPTSTIAQVPSVSSVSGGPGGQATSSSSGTSPDVTSAISLTQESRGRETTEVPHSSNSASLLTDKIWVGTTATSSSTINSQTSSGSPLPEGFTSGKTVAFKPALSSDSHTTPSTTELFSDTNILDTAQGTKGNVSPTFRGDISPTVSEASTTGRPTGESISTSSSNSPQETPPISQKAQTRGVGTNSRSETISSVSRVADSFPTAIPSPPSSTPNGHSSPGSMGPTRSPSSPIATFSSSPDRESHTPQTATSVFPTGSTEGTPVLSSGTVSDVTSHSPSTMWSTSGEVLPTSTSLSDTPDNVTATHPVGSESVSLTETTQVPSSSVGISRKTTTRHPVTVQSVAPATDPIPSPTYVSSTSHPISTAGSTHTSSDETTSHSSPRTTVMTASGTSTSEPTTSHAFTLTPTSAVSSSSDTDTATELGSSPLSPVTTQGSAGDVSPTVSGHSASDASATAEPTRQSTPLSASTSPAEPAAVTQMSNTQGAHATQESQTSRSGFPSTNTIRTVTATTPSSYPSGQSASESVPLNTPPQGTGTVSGPALSGKSHTTWASTTEEWATPMSPDTTLGTSGDTSLSPTSTIAQVTSVVSVSVGSGREATSPSPRTSPDGKSAFSQTHQPRGTETTGAPHTSKSASSLTDTTWEGTTAPSSFTVVRQASSGSPPPEKFTSGATAPLTTTLSSDSHTTPTTTELLSNSATLATTPETILPKGTTATISEASTTGRPTGQSISISFSTPSRETPSISQITQTKGMGTISGSETISSVSRVTDTFPTAISSAPSSAPNVGTSPQAMGHTLSPSSPIISFSSTPVSDGHTRQTGRTHLATGSTERLHAVTSGPLSDVTSHFSTMQSTNGEVLPTGTSFSDIHDNVTTSHPVGSEGVLLTETAQVPSSPVAVSDEPTAGRPVAVQSVASATNPITSPTYVTSTSNSIGTAGTTLTQSDEPTFRSSPRTSPMTTSDTSTSQPTTTYTFTPTPTLAVSPSGDAHTATELWSSPISPVTTQGEPRDISPTDSGSSTSSASTATDSTRQSAPLSTNTSPVETGTVSQMTHTQGAQTTQQPRTSRSAFPNTDTIRIVTATAPSSYPSGHSSSESLPLDTATTDSLTISTSVPSGMSHTTQAPTVEQWASPMSLDTTLGMLGDTSLSPTSTIAQVPSVSSVSGGPGGQATSSSSGTSPDVTSAISLTQESRGRETTEVPHSSNSASLLTDKIWVGTTATSSSTINSQTSSGSPLPEGFTSGKTVAFKPALSSDSHTTPSTTELFSDTNILDTAQGTKGNVSPTFRGDISPTVSEASTTGRPTGESISTCSSNSPQETPPISQKAQTRGVGTNSRSETISSVSRVADSFPTAIPSPPSSTPNGHSSPGSMGPTRSPSSPIATFSSSPDRESHTPQTATSVFPTGSTEGTPVLSSGTVSDVTSHSPSTMWSTSGEVLPTSTSLSDTPDNVTATHPVGSESVSLTETTQVPSSSVGISRKTTTRHPVTVQSVAPATDPIPSPTYVSSTSHPISTAGSTHTSSDETTSHSSPRTTVMTASGTSTSEPTTSHAFTLTPTSAVSSSSDTDTATELGSSPLSPVTTQGSAGDVSPTVSGHSASDASATAEPTRQSTPLSASTSPAEPAAVTQMSNTQGAHATQESQTLRSGFPSTNTIRTVTATTPSSYPSGQSASESVPLNTPPQGTGTVSGPALSGKSHTTWASTTEEWATPMSPDTTLGTSGDTSLSPTSTIAQVTSVVSVSVGSGREATTPSPRTSPDGKSAFSRTHQPRGTETTGAPHTSKSASLLTDTTWEGTTAPSSFTVVRQASSGSLPPEKFTSGATAPLTTTLSSDSHTTPTTTELLSNAATLATTLETIMPKGMTATISEASTTGRPTGQSISISFSTPSRETPSISQITQTKGMGTISGSETISSVSRVTDTFPTAISSAPSSAPNVGTSPQAMGHTLSPSSPIITFSSTAVSDGHTHQTGMPSLRTGLTEVPPAVTSGPLNDVTSHFCTMQSTSGEVFPTGTSFSDIHDNVTTAHPVGSEGLLLTETAQVPSSSLVISDESTAGRPVAVQSVASATDCIISPTYVTSTSNPIVTAGTTLTQSDEPTFHSSSRTSPMTTSDNSTSQPTTTYTFTPTPTLAVSPSGDAHTATELWSSPISPVTTQGEPRDISPTVSGSSTSSASTATDSTRQSAPLSTNTSPVEMGTVSQMTHTQGTQTTQQPRTSRSAFPNTETISVVTASAPSSYPGGHSASESVPFDRSTTRIMGINTPAPPGMSRTTQSSTSEKWDTSTILDITLRISGDTSLSPTNTIAQVPSVVSVLGGPGQQATLPFSSTSPATTSEISQSHQSRGIGTTAAHSSRLASFLTDITWAGTTPTSSTIISQTSSGSPPPERFTSSEATAFIPTVSNDSHTTPSTTELLSSSNAIGTAGSTHTSLDEPNSHSSSTTTLMTTAKSNTSQPTTTYAFTPTPYFAVSLTNDADAAIELWSSPINPITTQENSVEITPTVSGTSTSDVPATTEPIRQTTPLVTRTFTDEQAAVSQTTHIQGAQTTQEPQTSRSGLPRTDRIRTITTATSSSYSSGPSASEIVHLDTSTAGMITSSLRTDSKGSTAAPLPLTASRTLKTSTPSTSTLTHSKAPPVPIKPEKGVSLFPFGSRVGDHELVKRIVDFTSPLFKPQIGFPFGFSLRDSLYFTDNGQIIFPESDYKIFSYPNPPLSGFTGWDPVALVAPFWNDADFSSHQGTIFYQEYKTLHDDYHPLVQQVESWIVRVTDARHYKARWTLKVTWVKAPAYPAHWTFGTNTYQAILSTDGSRSYALFVYQSSGMQWDMTQHPSNSVLMGFSSGDGYFQNSPLTFQPVWKKYRPDQFLDSNSGLRGLQVYKLHGEEKPNYRLKCLRWLERQPQWPGWGWSQISCPCSWQQGRWDLRFQPISLGWWGLSSRQLCSFSTQRGGVCCSYGLWGELREGWRVPSLQQFDQELEPQNWCCHWNDKPFFCALYQQRRPRIGCSGYRPPRTAWLFGDPHITTLDGANFTFNGLGDFLLVRAWDRDSSFLLQGRTAQTGSAKATNFIAFAVLYNSSSLGPVTVQWFLELNDTIRILFNNHTVIFETSHEDAEGQEIFNTTGVILTRNGSLVSANFDGMATVSVMALSNILHASSSLPEEYRNHTEGLLGVWNDNPDDDFRMPNGSIIPHGSSEKILFHYGMTWEINGTSLLGKRNDHLPSNFTPVFLSQLLTNNSFDDNLISGCNNNTRCIYDTLVTKNRSTGLHTRTLFRRYQLMNATLNQYPPSIEGQHVVEAYKGQTKWIQYTSNSKNVTFTLRNSSDDFILFENGTLLWTPKSLEPFTLEILARNSKDVLSSVLQPKTVVCNCTAESQCLFNQTSRVGNSSLEVAACQCDGDTYGLNCEHSKNLCEEPCYPNVKCNPGKGCEACPPNMTGDGRHCASLENSVVCQNKSCPMNYCYNNGHCYISQTLGCKPTCTCPPAFTDTRCFLAGNNFTPTAIQELPSRVIQLLLSEDENASIMEVNTSVAYRLGTLDIRAFLWNSLVEPIGPPTSASGRSLQRWKVISEFQYRPRGPVIDFLNNRLLDAVVEEFLLQAPRRTRSAGPRNNVAFQPISRAEVSSEKALNVSTLETYFRCIGYTGYRLAYSPQQGLTCVSPCSAGFCEHGGQCQHLPDGPRCSCMPFSIYTPWGEHCEHLSMKLGAFFGILFGALGSLLLLGAGAFVALRFLSSSGTRYSYPLDSES